MSDEIFEDMQPGVSTAHTDQPNVVRTNVQGWDEWIAEQMLFQEERLAKYDREDYYSILKDLYERVNPSVSGALIAGVRQWSPSMEWLDRAIVVVTALDRGHSPPQS
jgi:hypothetical protein